MTTPYNDLRLEADKRSPGAVVRVPNVVVERVRELAIKLFDETSRFKDSVTGLTCDELISPVYRIHLIGDMTLFVSSVQITSGPQWFYFIIYDPKTDRATISPPRVEARWPNSFGAQDWLVNLPLISLADLTGDAIHQLVFEERVHNGTVYNGIIYHYFEVGPGLRLTRVLSRETRVIDIAHDGYFIDREVERDGANRLRLNVYDDKPGGPRKLLGYAILGRRKGGDAFRVLERRLRPGVSAESLITWCESPNDDDFLRHGCDVY